MRRILWMKGGALGDFVVGLPVLAALRRAFPEAWIEAVGPRAWLELTTGYADERTPLEASCWSSLYGDGRGLPATLEATSLAVVLRPDPEGVLERHLLAAGVGRVLLLSPVPEGTVHVIEHLGRVLEPIGLPIEPWPRVLHPAVSGAGEPREVFLHPGSGGRLKCWPAGRFREVAETLRARGLPVVIVLGPVELERGEAASWTDLPVLEAPGLWSLAGRLARARLFIGNDSGVSHLAAAAGCPTLTLFGPTEPAVWAPRGPCVRVITAGESLAAETSGAAGVLGALSVRRVLEAVDELLENQSHVAA